MKVTNYKKSEEGISSFQVLATEVETGLLVNIGLDTMIEVGLLSMADLENTGKTEVDLSNLDESLFFKV